VKAKLLRRQKSTSEIENRIEQEEESEYPKYVVVRSKQTQKNAKNFTQFPVSFDELCELKENFSFSGAICCKVLFLIKKFAAAAEHFPNYPRFHARREDPASYFLVFQVQVASAECV